MKFLLSSCMGSSVHLAGVQPCSRLSECHSEGSKTADRGRRPCRSAHNRGPVLQARHREARRFAQAPLDAVARHGIAQLLRHREAETRRLSVLAVAHLHDDALGGKGSRLRGGEKILPFQRRSIVAAGLNAPARLSRQPLAALRPAARNHLAAALGRHAGTKAMAALADKLGGLKSALHDRSPSSALLPALDP